MLRSSPEQKGPTAPAAVPVDAGAAWSRYCGFLDLSLQEFMDIQRELLLEQLQLIQASPLGRRLLRGRPAPKSAEEFCASTPLTTYSDYAPYLAPDQDRVLGTGPLHWAHTTGAQADFKWVPYTDRGLERLLDNLMAAFILAAASRRGDVRVWPGATILYNTPARPYLSGLATFGLRERFGFRGVLNPEVSEGLEFKERIRRGFKEALGKNVDVIISMTSVLVKVGEGFSEQAPRAGIDRAVLRPRALLRVGKALVKSKVLNRPVLPKDLWPTKAIVGWGVDTPFFKDQVARYWGKVPSALYACTEGGIMGIEPWQRDGMVFSPYSDFYEFIPLEESLKSREDDRYRPRTRLLDQVKPGQTYEVVITNFYGMAFVRYRVGHFVEFLSSSNRPETSLPRFSFIGRADDRIDLAGFTRVDEKTVWQALEMTGLPVEDWTIRKEYAGEAPVLHLLLELKALQSPNDLTEIVHAKLKEVDPFYTDLETMLGIRPLKVTCLPPGTFDRFYESRLKAGELLGRRKPARMNSSDDDVVDLLKAAS